MAQPGSEAAVQALNMLHHACFETQQFTFANKPADLASAKRANLAWVAAQAFLAEDGLEEHVPLLRQLQGPVERE